MHDTDASDSKRPHWYSSGFLPEGLPPVSGTASGSGMSSASGMVSTGGTPGQAVQWEDMDINDAPANAPAGAGVGDAALQQRIGEFESAFGERRGKGKGEHPGAVANIGKTALMRAAEAGDADSVQRLIDAGANVNATDMSGRTALMWAALGGHVGAVRLLLYAGADAHASHKNGVTAFMLAQARGHTNVVNILHAVTGEGDDPPPPPPPTAVFSSRRRAIQFTAASALLFAAAGALLYSMGVFDRPQPVPVRAVQGNVGDLLHAIDINERDANGQTRLMRAAASGDADRVRRLIAVGAHLDTADKRGNTALALAQKAGHKDIADMLRKAGASTRKAPAKPQPSKPQQQQKRQ